MADIDECGNTNQIHTVGCHKPAGDGDCLHCLVQRTSPNGLDFCFAVFSQYPC